MASRNSAATRAQLDELALKHRKNPGYHALNAEWFETEGWYSNAESEYRLALHEVPVDFKVRHPLGLLLWREGELNEGAEELRQAAAADPHAAPAFTLIWADCCSCEAPTMRPIAKFQKTVYLVLNQASAHRALASALLLAGQNV